MKSESPTLTRSAAPRQILSNVRFEHQNTVVACTNRYSWTTCCSGGKQGGARGRLCNRGRDTLVGSVGGGTGCSNVVVCQNIQQNRLCFNLITQQVTNQTSSFGSKTSACCFKLCLEEWGPQKIGSCVKNNFCEFNCSVHFYKKLMLFQKCDSTESLVWDTASSSPNNLICRFSTWSKVKAYAHWIFLFSIWLLIPWHTDSMVVLVNSR